MTVESENASENPYETPQGDKPALAPAQHRVWTLIINSALLSVGVLVVLHWAKEFGIPGVTMLLGGYSASHLGWRLSKKRWWGLAIGAVSGFTIGAVIGIIVEFVLLSRV